MKPRKPKNELYRTLGVEPDATPGEIKRVYRDKANAAHPDKKSGSHEEMAKLNEAYEVLIDPSRRQLYDSTGQEAPEPIEVEARNLVLMGFSAALQSNAPVVLKFVRQYIEKNRAGIKQSQSEIGHIQKTLKARRGKVTIKKRKGKKKEPETINLFHSLVDQELEHLKLQTLKMERDLEVCDKAEEELDRYESDEKEPEEPKRRILMAYGFDISAGL